MKDVSSLNEAREVIDALDVKIVQLMNDRAKIAKKVGILKNGQNIYQPAREAEVLARIKKSSSGELPDSALQTIYTEIISACRNAQKPLGVAFLGPCGTFTEEAAQKLFGKTCNFISCDSIEKSISSAESASADIAVVPIENSSEGAVTATYDRLQKTNLRIFKEIALPIRHQLLSSDNSLSDIKKVFAHPQALAQCKNWLNVNLFRANKIAFSSNAEAAKQAACEKSTAAIASVAAAKEYSIKIIQENIQDNPNNTTRFVALGNFETAPTGCDNTKIICTLPNRPGSLHELLSVFSEADINMTALQSRPSPASKWEYLFFIDIDGHQQDAKIAGALKSAQKIAANLKIAGSYRKNENEN